MLVELGMIKCNHDKGSSSRLGFEKKIGKERSLNPRDLEQGVLIQPRNSDIIAIIHHHHIPQQEYSTVLEGQMDIVTA